ncbi:MAG: hypothetical protein H7A39_06610 [Chlamydiales bacterium]|nr:hypothetical protein [Chlamydiales bacterium]
MVYSSLGYRLYNHQIDRPRPWKQEAGQTVGNTGGVLIDNGTRRIHHFITGIAHIPAALIDLISAVALSCFSVCCFALTVITLMKVDAVINFSNGVYAQTKEYWKGAVIFPIAGICKRIIGTVNPYSTWAAQDPLGPSSADTETDSDDNRKLTADDCNQAIIDCQACIDSITDRLAGSLLTEAKTRTLPEEVLRDEYRDKLETYREVKLMWESELRQLNCR